MRILLVEDEKFLAEPLVAILKKNKYTVDNVYDGEDGLDYGADDYMPKPFNTDELLARIRAVGRRKSEIVSENSELKFGDIILSTALLRLSSPIADVTLTLKECELMEYLIRNSTMLLSKDKIIEKLWGYDSEAEDNHVEVYISFLRKKLTYINSTASILTVRGVGYKLCSKD